LIIVDEAQNRIDVNKFLNMTNSFCNVNPVVFLVLFTVSLISKIHSQSKIGTNPTNLNSSAVFELESNNRGFLPPRMTAQQMLAIQIPSEGLVVYCTNCKPKGLRVFDNEYWVDMKATVPGSTVLYHWDFEGATPFNNLGFELSSPNSITVVNDPLNPSNKVMKTVLLQGNDRTEVFFSNLSQSILYYYADANPGFTDQANTIANSLSLGHELWISVKILKPQEQNTNGIKPCFFQFGPVNNLVSSPTQGSRGFWQLRMTNGTTPTGDFWNSRIFGNTPFTPAAMNQDHNFVSKPYGVWEHFVFHFKYSATSGGIVEGWKDGVKYINVSGQNAYAFNRSRIKWGIYLGVGNSAGQTLTCYFDDVKIGGANSSYEDISQ
jgi:hypothetical protein